MKKNVVWFVLALGLATLAGCSSTQAPEVPADVPSDAAVSNAAVKEFSMESFTEIKDGKYFPQYSIKEITVKKGDKIKIKIKTTSGEHDFNIDEFNVKAETPLDEEVVVEFTADKVGEFIYYCSKPGHRENGHWGTLIVTE